MPSGSEVADKAVSTEDTSEMVHIDAVLAALVETKVEAMKAAATRGKWSSAPASPRRPRLTSSSTVSSSQNQHHYDTQHHRHYRKEFNGRHRRHRRYDSAPCEEFIEDLERHHHRKHRSGG